MNKTLKGTLALAVAALLLLGGFGTYALWTDTETLDGGTIAAGELKLDGAAPGVWTDVSDGGTGTVIPDIADFLIVPGDVLTYSLTRTVLAKGDNLQATLVADPSTVTGDPELLTDVEIDTAVTIGGVEVSAITDANDGQTVTVLVTFTFAEASENPTQLQELDLSALELTLEQDPR